MARASSIRRSSRSRPSDRTLEGDLVAEWVEPGEGEPAWIEPALDGPLGVHEGRRLVSHQDVDEGCLIGPVRAFRIEAQRVLHGVDGFRGAIEVSERLGADGEKL